MWRFKFCSLFVCVFSAGVGRSGTFVALLWLMQLCVRGIRPDIRAAVEDLRLHRMWMVQNLVSLLTFTGSQTLAFHKQIGLYICSIFIKTQWPHIVSPARACSFCLQIDQNSSRNSKEWSPYFTSFPCSTVQNVSWLRSFDKADKKDFVLPASAQSKVWR